LAAGVGWVPANHALTPLGPLAEPSPFGATGDLRLLPDISTRARVAAEGAEGEELELVLCDIVETDGTPWECCPRRFLRAAVAELEGELGARAVVSFEHELQLLPGLDHDGVSRDGGGHEAVESPAGPAPALPFSLRALRGEWPFAVRVVDALTQAGVAVERIFAEFAARQLEIPVVPADALVAADRAVVLREVVHDVARRGGRRVTLTPLLDAGEAGNGVHVHLSLLDSEGRSVLYDAERAGCLSELGGRFAAGVLEHAGALSALTAPSPVSGARLAPHRWSAGAVCVGERNREALLRIPPLVTLGGGEPAAQMRLEYRGADAAANPYLALGAILRAGLEGLRAGLPAPPILERDPAELSEEEAVRFGVGALPSTLAQALAALAEDGAAREWLGPLLYEAYMAVKRFESASVAEWDLARMCRRYAEIY
jgi:glutamine synthetase